jgi:hypothetical protein
MARIVIICDDGAGVIRTDSVLVVIFFGRNYRALFFDGGISRYPALPPAPRNIPCRSLDFRPRSSRRIFMSFCFFQALSTSMKEKHEIQYQ